MKYFLRTCAVLGAVLLIIGLAAGAAVWRLAEGPVALPFLDSNIRKALAESMPDTDVDFEHTVVQWTEKNGLDLTITDASLEDKATDLAIRVPEISLRFDPAELLKFNIAPTGIRIQGAKAALQWSAAEIRAGMDGTAEGISVDKDPVIIFISRLLQSPDREGPIGQLTRIRLVDAGVRLTEEKSGVQWDLNDLELLAERSAKGARLSVSARLETRDGQSDISLDLPLAENGEAQLLTVGFMEINPAQLFGDIAEAEDLAAMNLPISGAARVSFSGNGANSVEFDLAAAAGTVIYPGLYENAPTIETATVKGRYVIADKTLTLTRISSRFGGAQFNGDGLVSFLPAGPEVHFRATLEDMDLRRLLEYWPASVAAGGHDWVSANMPKGYIPAANIWVKLTPDMLQADRLPEEAFQISFSFENATAHYLKPMPPITEGSGTARLTADSLMLVLETGIADGIPLSSSDVILANLQEKGQNTADISVRVAASVPDILRLIDYEPLGYTSKYGIVPGSIMGNAVTVTKLKFPLIKALELDQVEIQVDAGITSLAIPELLTGEGLTNGRLAMTVTASGLDANGVVTLNGVPFDLAWRENFTELPAGEFPSFYHLTGALDSRLLSNFGVTAGQRIQGPIAAELMLRGFGPDIVEGRAKISLGDASLSIEELGWHKPAGVPLMVDFPVEWINDRVLIAPLRINQADTVLDANLAFDRETGELRAAVVSRLIMADNQFSALVAQPEGAPMTVDMTAESFDARVFLRSIFESDPNAPPMPPLRLNVKAKKVIGLHDVIYTNMVVDAENEGDYWKSLSLTANLDSGAPLLLTILPEGDHRKMSITSEDAGRTALGLGFFVNGEGGVLDLKADLIGRGDTLVVKGDLEVKDFRLVRSASLVKAIELGGQGNFDEHISKKGLSLNKLVLPFEIRDGIVDITDARANGPSIGFTMKGQIDQGLERINVDGIIVPMFMLNNLLGKIPILGDILVGGKGEGLFALTYRIEGDAANPEVTVNPMTALAPGIFRNLFEGKKGTVEIPAKTTDQTVSEPPPDKMKLAPAAPQDQKTVPDSTKR